MTTSKYAHRDEGVAIAKAIGIIFVVTGHCCASIGWQHHIHDFIFLFHMALFFFLSGYFFNLKYLNSKRIFIKKKLKGLWLPYVEWAMIFVLLHNLLFYLGMYGTWQGVMPESYSPLQMIKILGAVLHMYARDPLIYGFWFIPVLFYAALLSLCALYIVKAVFEELRNYTADIQDKYPKLRSLTNKINFDGGG